MWKKKRKKIGMSLIDMIIAIAIFALGMQVFTLVFVKIWSSNSFILEEGEASLIASRAVNSVAKNIRKTKQADNGDYPIESADQNDLKVFLDFDNDGITERVHYYLEGEEFKVGVTKPSGTPPIYPSEDQSVVVLASSVINNILSEPVFHYYNADYPGDLTNNPLPYPASIENIRLASIHFYVNIKPDHAPDHINIESMAEFRNLNDYDNF